MTQEINILIVVVIYAICLFILRLRNQTSVSSNGEGIVLLSIKYLKAVQRFIKVRSDKEREYFSQS